MNNEKEMIPSWFSEEEQNLVNEMKKTLLYLSDDKWVNKKLFTLYNFFIYSSNFLTVGLIIHSIVLLIISFSTPSISLLLSFCIHWVILLIVDLICSLLRRKLNVFFLYSKNLIKLNNILSTYTTYSYFLTWDEKNQLLPLQMKLSILLDYKINLQSKTISKEKYNQLLTNLEHYLKTISSELNHLISNLSVIKLDQIIKSDTLDKYLHDKAEEIKVFKTLNKNVKKLEDEYSVLEAIHNKRLWVDNIQYQKTKDEFNELFTLLKEQETITEKLKLLSN